MRHQKANGIFKSKIKASSAYKAWLTRSDAYKQAKKNISFAKSDNSDLFYSLHTITINKRASSSQGALVRVYDEFDFDFKTMGSLFTTLVNDWAALCTYTGILGIIPVYIDFYY